MRHCSAFVVGSLICSGRKLGHGWCQPWSTLAFSALAKCFVGRVYSGQVFCDGQFHFGHSQCSFSSCCWSCFFFLLFLFCFSFSCASSVSCSRSYVFFSSFFLLVLGFLLVLLVHLHLPPPPPSPPLFRLLILVLIRILILLPLLLFFFFCLLFLFFFFSFFCFFFCIICCFFSRFSFFHHFFSFPFFFAALLLFLFLKRPAWQHPHLQTCPLSKESPRRVGVPKLEQQEKHHHKSTNRPQRGWKRMGFTALKEKQKRKFGLPPFWVSPFGPPPFWAPHPPWPHVFIPVRLLHVVLLLLRLQPPVLHLILRPFLLPLLLLLLLCCCCFFCCFCFPHFGPPPAGTLQHLFLNRGQSGPGQWSSLPHGAGVHKLCDFFGSVLASPTGYEARICVASSVVCNIPELFLASRGSICSSTVPPSCSSAQPLRSSPVLK